MNLQWQFYSQNNNSTHSFQDYSNSYRRFVPHVELSYRNVQYGDYDVNYSLSYAKTSDYPTLEQLVFLVDSSNIYSMYIGNSHLKAYDKQEASFRLTYHSLKLPTPIHYSFGFSGGTINNSIVDSSIVDPSGRRIHYFVNANGYKFLSGFGSLTKAFKFEEHQIQVEMRGSTNIHQYPSYINNVYNLSKGINGSGFAKIGYTFKDWLAVRLLQRWSFYKSRQAGLNNESFKTRFSSTDFSASVSLTKRLVLRSNISYNQTTSSGSQGVDFTIWNTNLSYRLFKEHNGEVKFSALDLLHQNTSIINRVYNNSLIRGSTTVLQPYFMLSFSYFPRQFGLRNHKTD